MNEEEIKKQLGEFFRFYDKEKDGFEETRPMYEDIVWALAKSGNFPETIKIKDKEEIEKIKNEGIIPIDENGVIKREDLIDLDEKGEIDKTKTLDKVILVCKSLDNVEINRVAEELKLIEEDPEKAKEEKITGKMEEKNLGLYGFFGEVYKKKGKDIGKAALALLKTDKELKAENDKLENEIEEIENELSKEGISDEEKESLLKRQKEKKQIKKFNEEALNKINEDDKEVNKINKEIEKIKEELSNKELSEEERETKEKELKKALNKKQLHYEARAFLGELAAGPYFPRSTCASATHFMGKGRIMQIGCSQGKTSIVSKTTYVQLMMGEGVYSTSSSPGLVPENYDEARAFYELMGIADEFCAISQNATDNVEHIVLFHKGKKYEVRSDGQIWIETAKKDKDGKPIYDKLVMSEMGKEELKEYEEKLGFVLSEGKLDFESSVKKMMAEKGIIMGDTITLGKYQDLMPERNDKGVIENSFLIVDEADAELYDSHPQELLGEEYPEEIAEKRKKDRIRARDIIATEFDGQPDKLEELAEKNNIPLDFLLDAYEAQTDYGEPSKYAVRDGKVFILNPKTNVMIPAPQGVAQAIIANDESLGNIPEKEVLGETDIPKLFSNFELASLMSGSMKDKGLASDKMSPEYKQAIMNFLQKCGPGIAAALGENGIMDWSLVTPMTRDEKGSVVVTREGIERKEGVSTGIDIATKGEKVTSGWRQYIEENSEKLEEEWRKAVQEEAKARSNEGKPVMVSVYGDRNPLEGTIDLETQEPMVNPIDGKPIQTYTDKNQIGGIHEIGDDKCLFVKDGKGEIAVFDDFYGRGYTFKFIHMDKDGKPVKNENGGLNKVDKGGHVLVSALPDNSRNLEQFLFRVARGGEKGSSSIIISPADPVLIDYLEKLEEEKGEKAANDYFNGVMSGEISVEQIVLDIYPKESEKIFKEKAHLIMARDEYESQLKDICSSLYDDKQLAEIYANEYKKQMVGHMKSFRLFGVPERGKVLAEQDKLQCSVAKTLIEQGKVKDPKLIRKLLPDLMDEKQLKEIIKDEKLCDELSKMYIIENTTKKEFSKIINNEPLEIIGKEDNIKKNFADIKKMAVNVAKNDPENCKSEVKNMKELIGRIRKMDLEKEKGAEEQNKPEDRGDIDE